MFRVDAFSSLKSLHEACHVTDLTQTLQGRMQTLKLFLVSGIVIGFMMKPCVIAADLPQSDFSSTPRSIVSTLSGSGIPGVLDDAALESQFVLPVAVAVASDGSVVVADAGANRIRRIKAGHVDLVAGQSSQLFRDRESWSGGYRDGPAALARFNRPTGVAVGRNGEIYVADSGNHCVRVIREGEVRTLAGSTTPGDQDGRGGLARFGTLTGIAIDDDGILYVSDYSVGIRRIDSDGEVTTLRPAILKPQILGVSARRYNGRLVIAFTENDDVHLVVNGNDQVVTRTQDRMPNHEGVPVFSGWGIALLNENTVAVTDVVTSTIRLIRFPVLPFTDVPASETLAGALREEPDFNGGFLDGPSSVALFAAPRGIALAPDGGLVIADSGNRRIRLIAGFSSRETTLPNFSNYKQAADDFNIVMIGQSYLFNGVLWPDSIPGRVEDVLNGERHAIGLTKRVHVDGIRADGIDGNAMFDLIENYVVTRPNIRVVTLLLTPITYIAVDDLVGEQRKLREQGIDLVVGVMPLAEGVSVSERPYPQAPGFPDASFYEGARLQAQGLARAYEGAGISMASLVPEMVAHDQTANRAALYNMLDNHMSVAGQRFVGELFAEKIASDKPWNGLRAPPEYRSSGNSNSCPVATAMPANPELGHVDQFRVDGGGLLSEYASIKRPNKIVVEGWAVGGAVSSNAQALCLLIDNRSGVAAISSHNGIRLDVVSAFLRPELVTSGFQLLTDIANVPAGRHSIGIGVYGTDGVVRAIDGARVLVISH